MRFDQHGQVNRLELAFSDNQFAAHNGVIRLDGRAEDQRSQRVVQGAGQTQLVQVNGEEIGAFAWSERADVRPPEHRCAAAGSQLKRLAGSHQRWGILSRKRSAQQPGAQPGDQHCLADLCQQVRAVIAGRAIDAQANLYPRLEHIHNGCDSGSQAHIGGGAVGHSAAAARV